VVDNEAEPNNRAAVEAQAARFPFPLAYEHELRRGIPFARNRVLDHALAIEAEWIAFIDDDEIAEPDWLSQLVSAAERYSCNVVQGQVYQFADGEEPSRENGKRKWAEGKALSRAATDNIIFHASLVRNSGHNLYFDAKFALSGGSDTDFFSRASVAGARIMYTKDAVVYERLMLDRLGTSAAIKRQFSNQINAYVRNAPRGKSADYILYAARELTKRKLALLEGFFKIALGLLFFPFCQDSGRKEMKKGVRKVINMAATTAAIFGYRYERYRKISGE
jgi:glycosyltransferase involved in cell wall biosynthesis